MKRRRISWSWLCLRRRRQLSHCCGCCCCWSRPSCRVSWPSWCAVVWCRVCGRVGLNIRSVAAVIIIASSCSSMHHTQQRLTPRTPHIQHTGTQAYSRSSAEVSATSPRRRRHHDAGPQCCLCLQQAPPLPPLLNPRCCPPSFPCHCLCQCSPHAPTTQQPAPRRPGRLCHLHVPSCFGLHAPPQLPVLHE